MVKLSEDPKYGFAIGRIRALEPTLMDRPRYERFLRARNGGEFIAALAESAYGRLLEGGASGVNRAFASAEKENMDFFSAYALDEWLLQVFSLRTAVRELKTSVKSALAQGRRSVSIPAELEVNQSAVDGAVAAVFERFARDRNPAAADMALDRLLQQIQLRAASGSDFLTGYFGLHADMENLRTLVRLKGREDVDKDTKGEMAASYLKGGALTLDSLISALGQPWEAILDFLAKAPPYGVGSEEFREYLEQGRAAVTDRRSFVRMERLGREAELRYLRQTRYATFGHEPLVAFFLLRENELRNLRLLYAARLAGLAEDDSQDLVAYVD